MKQKEILLKEISSKRLLQELIVRCENQVMESEAEMEATQYTIDELQEIIEKLNEIVLE